MNSNIEPTYFFSFFPWKNNLKRDSPSRGDSQGSPLRITIKKEAVDPREYSEGLRLMISIKGNRKKGGLWKGRNPVKKLYQRVAEYEAVTSREKLKGNPIW